MVTRMFYQYRLLGHGFSPESNVTLNDLQTGKFLQANRTIRALRIQGPPGTAFVINNGTVPAILGLSGNFYIDEKMNVIITSLKFPYLTQDQINLQGIIIDTVEVDEI